MKRKSMSERGMECENERESMRESMRESIRESMRENKWVSHKGTE